MTNVEIVRAVYDAWGRGEFPGPPELLDPRIEYVNPVSATESGVRHGIDAFARAVERTFESWETWDMAAERFAAEGNRVAVLVHYRARGRRSGAEVEGSESALWTVDGGRVVRYEWFHGPDEAFDALGLSQPK